MNIEDKVDRIYDTIVKMETHVEKNTEDLAEHIKRTAILEGKLQKLFYVAIFVLGTMATQYKEEIFKLLGLVI